MHYLGIFKNNFIHQQLDSLGNELSTVFSNLFFSYQGSPSNQQNRVSLRPFSLESAAATLLDVIFS